MKQSAWRERLDQPVDAGIFLEMIEVWQSAADKPLRPEGLEPPQNSGAEGLMVMLSDIPMNRSALAVTAALRQRNIEPVQAYLLRVMHLGDIIESRDMFAQFIRTTDDGQFEISDALLRAAAVARVEVSTDRMGFDLDDVLAHAERLKALEDQE